MFPVLHCDSGIWVKEIVVIIIAAIYVSVMCQIII